MKRSVVGNEGEGDETRKRVRCPDHLLQIVLTRNPSPLALLPVFFCFPDILMPTILIDSHVLAWRINIVAEQYGILSSPSFCA